MGFCYASSLEAGSVWLDPAKYGSNLVWLHPWPPDIIANLVLSKNLEGRITNSDLELAFLVLHKATLLEAAPTSRMAVPNSESDNTSTVLWITREASTIKPQEAEFLCIYVLHSRFFS